MVTDMGHDWEMRFTWHGSCPVSSCAKVSRPDFLLCGDTALFCYLARRSSAFRETPAHGGPELPRAAKLVDSCHSSSFLESLRLHMYGMVLLQYVPLSWRSKMLQDRSASDCPTCPVHICPPDLSNCFLWLRLAAPGLRAELERARHS